MLNPTPSSPIAGHRPPTFRDVIAGYPGDLLRSLVATVLVALLAALVLLDAALFGVFGPVGHGFPAGVIARELSWAVVNLTFVLWVVLIGVDFLTGHVISRRVFPRRTPPPARPMNSM